MCNIQTEEANPNPELLIKSIAEQGYSMETALADLIDNSISANATKIEILSKIETEPFVLFITDDGDGIDADSLKRCMQFPSQSVDIERDSSDLGRFGLGLKTASFSQTRCFTILSRKKGEKEYNALTWDVNYLKQIGEWRIIVNSKNEIDRLLDSYKTTSSAYLNSFDEFSPNTIIIWQGLYKFEDYGDVTQIQTILKTEITEQTTEYLSLVFHRFMERNINPLQIRINNVRVKPFNPFPEERTDIRTLEPSHGETGFLKIQGFVLPNVSIKESKEGLNIWTLKNKSLMDMEGIYIYRSDRLISFGGWNKIIKKEPKLQLARLKVDIDNNSDLLFHLNVAKSQIIIPYKLKNAFYRCIINLRDEAKKEFHNYGIKTFVNNQREDRLLLYNKMATNQGVLLVLNEDFPLLKSLKESLNKEQSADLNLILKLSVSLINTNRIGDKIEVINEQGIGDHSVEELVSSIEKLLKVGYPKDLIKKNILSAIGYGANNMPEEISNLLN